MCGFAGFVDFKGNAGKDVLAAMADTLSHRGPDDFGYEIYQHQTAVIGFGFRRLSIIDLSYAGHQPMKNDVNGDIIMFNGEIYNFLEIKSELIKLGCSFKSTGDAEVILKSYEQWGIKCVDKFIGMFSIVLFDQAAKKVVCIRDRAGIKPLFYYWKDDQFLFASELKAFHKHPGFEKRVNTNAVANYFQHGYISNPHTIFENTYQLPPASWLELNLETKKLTVERYWNLNSLYNNPLRGISYEEVLSKTEEIMISAFNYRMIADVPVGVFLSGGYDSSAVAAILQKTNSGKIKTYTIGFEEKDFNEAPYAKEVASYIGSDHHEYYCSFRDAMNLIPRIPEIYDQPFGDSSAIPTTLISGIARQFVKVALSADGGDELFAGYPRHLKSLNQIETLNRIPTFLKKLSSAFVPTNHNSLINANRADKLKRIFNSDFETEVFDIINQVYSGAELQKLLKFSFREIDTPFNTARRELSEVVETLNKIIAVDYGTYLVDDILHKVDRASMSVCLEAREPFLDHRLAEFLAVVPATYKIQGKNQKRILKDIVHKYIPKSIMERPKMGFGIPVHIWCRNELKDMFMDFMSDESLMNSEYLNGKNVIQLRDGYLKGQVQNFERIWIVFVFQMWVKKWL